LPGISSIVFLDALLPERGQRVVDLAPRELAAAGQEQGELAGAPPPKAFGIDEKDQPWVHPKTTPQPTLVSVQPLTLTGAHGKIGKKTHIRATSYPNAKFDEHFANQDPRPTNPGRSRGAVCRLALLPHRSRYRRIAFGRRKINLA
jgi:hypothetical protein